MVLRIHNTLSRAVEAFTPLEPGHVRLYVCGITVYDLSHIGHARMMVAFDVVQRWLRQQGWRVTYVRNITDIDDKIIRRAVERGMSLAALTEEMVQALHVDFAQLGIEAPTHEPRATRYVPQMQALIARLEQGGLAYQAESGGDVNFAVRRFPGYGKLSGKSLDQLRAGERVALTREKDDPLDFVLWKSAKPDEPQEAVYSSPWGPGRPGWHIECSAMSAALLGESFDIHGGGADLQFPHHENEIAQSEGASGRPMAQIWMHNGLLNLNDEKMSKSLGNFLTIRDLLKHYDGETLRFFMLRAHYRSPLAYSVAALDDARASLRRLYTALAGVPTGAAAPLVVIDWSEPSAARFKAAMDEDFNTPLAVAVLFELAAELNRERDPARAALLRALAGTLGLLQADAQRFLQGQASLDHAAIEARIAARAEAKARRDFATADAIRDALSAQGIVLQDGPGGTSWMQS